jgi:hypothetical protein
MPGLDNHVSNFHCHDLRYPGGFIAGMDFGESGEVGGDGMDGWEGGLGS